MAATKANINWKQVDENTQQGFVGDATNEAFTLRKTPNGVFTLSSEITDEENAGGTFADEQGAKDHADLLIEAYDIPKFGTVVDGNTDGDLALSSN